ncbi:MFS transporter [Nonomuraea sp. NPDC049625]|uniref:MFS transporter n=1 Tax=Nonomuraea sp. NPDC049625 TaxID=3155775 RepID=UPI0034424AA9
MRRHPGRATGVLGGVSGLATVTGPLLGGVLIDTLGWQWIFYVNVLVGIPALSAFPTCWNVGSPRMSLTNLSRCPGIADRPGA